MKKVYFILILFPFIVNAQINNDMKVTLLNKDKEFLLEIKSQSLILDSNKIIIKEQVLSEFLSHLDTNNLVNGIISFEFNTEIVYIYVLALHCNWIPSEYPYCYNFEYGNIYKLYFDTEEAHEDYKKILINY